MQTEHVTGKEAGKVMLYALSTCGWCRKTRQLLNDLGIAYDYTYVDLLSGKDRDEVIEAVNKWNPEGSFPTLVINDNKCVIGYKEDEIRENLK
ncbi:MAG: glutaredoxin family protein [Dehalococcoidales bacterium]|nr:glutaredoxin family protein [Dehalococcoidales bacterium]